MVNLNYLLMCSDLEIQKQIRYKILSPNDQIPAISEEFIIIPTLNKLSKYLRNSYTDLHSLVANLYYLAESLRNPHEPFPFESLEELLLALMAERILRYRWDIKEKKWKTKKINNLKEN